MAILLPKKREQARCSSTFSERKTKLPATGPDRHQQWIVTIEWLVYFDFELASSSNCGRAIVLRFFAEHRSLFRREPIGRCALELLIPLQDHGREARMVD